MTNSQIEEWTRCGQRRIRRSVKTTSAQGRSRLNHVGASCTKKLQTVSKSLKVQRIVQQYQVAEEAMAIAASKARQQKKQKVGPKTTAEA